MRDIRHLLLVAAISAGVIVAYLLLRSWLIPASFGEVGHYRNDSVAEAKMAPFRYAGEQSCSDCHIDKTAEKKTSAHRAVRCESCHGPQALHASNPGLEKPRRVREEDIRVFCARCHDRHISRPPSIKQIEEKSHNPGGACVLCHDPHRPKS